MSETVGFIGLGIMGRGMARNLLKAGFSVRVWNRTQSRVDELAAEGAATAQDPASLAAQVDILITCVSDTPDVEAVLVGDNPPGAIHGLRPGSLVIDMSTISPHATRALAEKLQARGVEMLDAPVSGGSEGAARGTLTIMVGGAAEQVARARPVFEAMGKTITHVGDAGAGHAVKALNNYVSAAGLTAAAEALLAGQRFGLDPAVMTDVINSSTGKNNTTEHKVKQYMLNGAFNSAFSLQLMAKDLGIAMALGKSVGQKMTLGDEVLDLWNQAAKALGKTADHTEMYRYLQSRN